MRGCYIITTPGQDQDQPRGRYDITTPAGPGLLGKLYPRSVWTGTIREIISPLCLSFFELCPLVNCTIYPEKSFVHHWESNPNLCLMKSVSYHYAMTAELICLLEKPLFMFRTTRKKVFLHCFLLLWYSRGVEMLN